MSTNLRINWCNGDGWLRSHRWLTAEVYARHYFPVKNIFDALDRQQDFLLMAQLDDADVFEIFFIQLRHVSDRLEAFVLQLCDVLVESQ